MADRDVLHSASNTDEQCNLRLIVLAGTSSNRSSASIASPRLNNSNVPSLKVTSKECSARHRFVRAVGKVAQHGFCLHTERSENNCGLACAGRFEHGSS